MLSRIGETPVPIGRLASGPGAQRSLASLRARGLVQVAGVTPSDASHVLGSVAAWDTDAAEKAMQLLGRKRTGSGERLA
ncbi:MAG: hypothetical protein KDG49_19675, partial [Geminicoccaceae bacterium]|nr:hypothetical protein [Geminicoccaceae bacterium]